MSGFDFVGKSLEFIPLALRELRGFGGSRGAYLPPCGGESEIEELARSGPNLRFRKKGAR
jgi:hypothetical protein